MAISPAKGLKLAAVALAALALVTPARAVDPDKYLTADSDVVAVINFRQMLESPLVKKDDLEKLKAHLKTNDEAQAFLNATGLDPFKDLDSVLVAGALPTGPGAEPKGVVVVRGRFDLDKIQAAAKDFAGKNPDKLKITEDGGRRVYQIHGKDGNDKAGYASFADKNTLVVTQSKEATAEAVKGGGAAAKVSPALKAALAKVKGEESMWVAVAFSDELKKKMAAGPNPAFKQIAPKLESATGEMNLGNDFTLNLFVHTSDEKAAQQIQGMINGFLPFVGPAVVQQVKTQNEEAGAAIEEVMKNLKVDIKNKTSVGVSLTIDKEQMEKLEKAQKDAKGKEKDKDK